MSTYGNKLVYIGKTEIQIIKCFFKLDWTIVVLQKVAQLYH